jgi:hypothetical protein
MVDSLYSRARILTSNADASALTACSEAVASAAEALTTHGPAAQIWRQFYDSRVFDVEIESLPYLGAAMRLSWPTGRSESMLRGPADHSGSHLSDAFRMHFAR